jgi:hypothetical protein
MVKKMSLLAALAALALAAIPANASAGTPEVHCGGTACGAFTVTGGLTEWSIAGFPTTFCTSITGTGNYTSKTGGTITLASHGCRDNAVTDACTTAAQPTGTVVLGPYEFENIYLTDDKTKPGILITNVNASYVCFTTIVTLKGSLIGELEGGCPGSAQTDLKLSFERTVEGSQRYMQSTGTGTLFDLQNSFGTEALAATGTVSFGAGKNPFTTCV